MATRRAAERSKTAPPSQNAVDKVLVSLKLNLFSVAELRPAGAVVAVSKLHSRAAAPGLGSR